jgi:hypothetical protein
VKWFSVCFTLTRTLYLNSENLEIGQDVGNQEGLKGSNHMTGNRYAFKRIEVLSTYSKELPISDPSALKF